MTLDRNELAARFAVADYGAKVATIYAGDPSKIGGATFYDDVADEAFKMADAFLDMAENIDARPVKSGPCPGEDARDDAEARKRIDTPVAPKSEAAKYEPRVYTMRRLRCCWPECAHEWNSSFEAHEYDSCPKCRASFTIRKPHTVEALPSPEATRPTWVRVTGTAGTTHVREGLVTIGKVYEVVGWVEDGAPRVIGNHGLKVALSMPDGSDSKFYATWEPATPPAPVEPAKGEARDEAYKALLAYAECDYAYCYGDDRRSEDWCDVFKRHGWSGDTVDSDEWLKALNTRALALARTVRS